MINVPGLNIQGPLGKGGTAAVAKAFFGELKKTVAIKYPLIDNYESIAQFAKLAKREHQLAGILRFPGIVNILKHSEQPSYLLLELCNGQSLDKLGKVDDPLMLMVITSAVAGSLEFLRLNDIIHCDLKPHNIFLPSDFPFYESGELFFAKISDFSLGRFINEPESARAGHGTVGYAAPEVSKSGRTSHKSDLFALGVIAYQLAAGKHPFSDGETDPLKIESRIQEENPVPLGKMRNDLPKQFIELVESLLSKDEKNRPHTAWQVCQILADCSCKYPYEKAIAPSFLLKTHKDFDKFVGQFMSLTDKHKSQLVEYTDSKTGFLRLLLSANFKRGNLCYSEGQFSFESNVYWPSYLRRRSLVFFSKANLNQKLEIIKSAISGQRKSVTKSPPGSELLFKYLLSSAIVKRASAKFARQNELNGEFATAAKLYLQSGKLDEATTCAEKTTADLDVVKKRIDTVRLINRVVEYAQLTGRTFDVKQLMKAKGDIQRAGGDAESALITYERIVELYKESPSDKLLAETYRDLGDLYKTKQKFDEGIKVLNKALEICREFKDDLLTSKILNKIGELYRIAADLDNSLKFVRQALAIQKRLGAVSDAASSLNSIAIIYGTKGKLKRTIALLTISLKMKRTLDDQGEIARTLNNLGLAHHLSGNSQKSLTFLKESLALNRLIGSQREIFSNLLNLSETMLKCGQLREAVILVNEGLEIAGALNLKPHQAHILKTMGTIYQKMNRFSESQDCYLQSSKIVNEIDDKVLNIRLLLSQSELCLELGDSQKAVLQAEQALQQSVSLKAGLEELQSLVILVRVLGKLELLSRARSLVEELKLDREKIILEFAYLQFLLDIEAKSDLKLLFAPLEMQLAKMRDDIEYPKLLNAACEILIICDDRKKAASLLSESRHIAQSKNLVSEEITSLILEGKIFFEEGNYEKAFVSFRTSLQLCKKASMTIASDQDKILFMKKPKMLFLANQIRQLNEKIGTKQKAGV